MYLEVGKKKRPGGEMSGGWQAPYSRISIWCWNFTAAMSLASLVALLRLCKYLAGDLWGIWASVLSSRGCLTFHSKYAQITASIASAGFKGRARLGFHAGVKSWLSSVWPPTSSFEGASEPARPACSSLPNRGPKCFSFEPGGPRSGVFLKCPGGGAARRT